MGSNLILRKERHSSPTYRSGSILPKDDENFAKIYCSDTIYMSRFDKFVEKYEDWEQIDEQHSLDGELVSKTYKCPKKFVMFQKKKRELTPEQREKAKERLQKYRETSQ